MNSFAVIGLGRFGREVALQLARSGAEVMAVDVNERLVNEIADDVTRAVIADVRDKESMEELGVAECDCVVLAIGGDLKSSVLGVMNLKALGARQLICKAYDAIHREILRKLGADDVIIPEYEYADRLATQLIHPGVQDYLRLTDGYSIEEIAVPQSWAGNTLGGLKVRNEYRINVVAIRRGTRTIVSPKAEEAMAKGDVLVALGNREALAGLRRLSEKNRN